MTSPVNVPRVVHAIERSGSGTECARAAGYARLQLRLLRRLVLADDLAPAQRCAAWHAWLANEFANGMDAPAEWQDWSTGAPLVVNAIVEALTKAERTAA